jgi:CRP-like cAMP-binding protein
MKSHFLIKHLTAGQSFGELALINRKPRMASIIASEDCHFAILYKVYFDIVLK